MRLNEGEKEYESGIACRKQKCEECGSTTSTMYFAMEHADLCFDCTYRDYAVRCGVCNAVDDLVTWRCYGHSLTVCPRHCDRGLEGIRAWRAEHVGS